MWDECLRAYHRLLELDHRFLDVGILGVLVRAVTEGDPEGPPGQFEGVVWAMLSVLFSVPASQFLGQVAGQDHCSRESPSGRVEAVCGLPPLQLREAGPH